MKILHSVIISLILLLSATTAHSGTYYFHNDHLGAPQVLTDENQAVVWKGDTSTITTNVGNNALDRVALIFTA